MSTVPEDAVLRDFGSPAILGGRSRDFYLDLLPLEVDESSYNLITGEKSPGILWHEDEPSAQQVVIPLVPGGFSSNWPPQSPPRVLSYSNGDGESEISVWNLPQPASPASATSSTPSQIAHDYANLDGEALEYMLSLKTRIGKLKKQKRRFHRREHRFRLLWIKDSWQAEEKRVNATVEIWANEVAVAEEMVRLRKEKVASDALLRAEVHRLKGENEALDRQVRLAARKTKRFVKTAEEERTAAGGRPQRTCKSKYRRK